MALESKKWGSNKNAWFKAITVAAAFIPAITAAADGASMKDYMDQLRIDNPQGYVTFMNDKTSGDVQKIIDNAQQWKPTEAERNQEGNYQLTQEIATNKDDSDLPEISYDNERWSWKISPSQNGLSASSNDGRFQATTSIWENSEYWITVGLLNDLRDAGLSVVFSDSDLSKEFIGTWVKTIWDRGKWKISFADITLKDQEYGFNQYGVSGTVETDIHYNNLGASYTQVLKDPKKILQELALSAVYYSAADEELGTIADIINADRTWSLEGKILWGSKTVASIRVALKPFERTRTDFSIGTWDSYGAQIQYDFDDKWRGGLWYEKIAGESDTAASIDRYSNGTRAGIEASEQQWGKILFQFWIESRPPLFSEVSETWKVQLNLSDLKPVRWVDATPDLARLGIIDNTEKRTIPSFTRSPSASPVMNGTQITLDSWACSVWNGSCNFEKFELINAQWKVLQEIQWTTFDGEFGEKYTFKATYNVEYDDGFSTKLNGFATVDIRDAVDATWTNDSFSKELDEWETFNEIRNVTANDGPGSIIILVEGENVEQVGSDSIRFTWVAWESPLATYTIKNADGQIKELEAQFTTTIKDSPEPPENKAPEINDDTLTPAVEWVTTPYLFSTILGNDTDDKDTPTFKNGSIDNVSGWTVVQTATGFDVTPTIGEAEVKFTYEWEDTKDLSDDADVTIPVEKAEVPLPDAPSAPTLGSVPAAWDTSADLTGIIAAGSTAKWFLNGTEVTDQTWSSLNLTGLSVGSYDVSLQECNVTGCSVNSSDTSFNILPPAITPPTLDNLPATITVGDDAGIGSISVDLSQYVSNCDNTCSYAVSWLPAGLTIDGSTGEISGVYDSVWEAFPLLFTVSKTWVSSVTGNIELTITDQG